MPKPAPETVARFEQLCEVVPEAESRAMFGCPSRMAAGYAFAGAHSSGIFVKLPPELGEQVLAEGGARFEPMPGRAMGGFYLLPDEGGQHWIRQAHDYVRTLPPKKTKKK